VELPKEPTVAWKLTVTSGTTRQIVLWGVLVLFVCSIMGILEHASYFQLKPYNGDVMASRIPDQCEPVIEKYLGKPGTSAQHEQYTVSLDTYGRMREALNKCIAEARIDVRQAGRRPQ
jgi:hypothetical protein